MEYIHINSIDDIKPEKISIRQLNNKYIDRYGNRYATKFNIKTKKVDIVRLATTKEEALRFRDEIKKTGKQKKEIFEKPSTANSGRIPPDYYESDDSFEDSNFFFKEIKSGSSFTNDSKARPAQDTSDNNPDPYLQDINISNSPEFTRRSMSGIAFYEKPFIDRCLEEIQKTKERQNAIISHIKKTKIFDQVDKDIFDELEREIDVECWQRGEVAVNHHRELFSYPRPLSYYLTRLNSEKKHTLESRKDEAEKLDLVRRWEIQESFETIFTKFHDVTKKIYKLLQEKIKSDDFKTHTAQFQQLLKDANTSCEIIIQSAADIIQQIHVWKNKYP